MGQPYQRPEPTKAEAEECVRLAVKLTANHSTRDIRLAVASILVENVRLTREVNDHRLARGFEALPTFNGPGGQ